MPAVSALGLIISCNDDAFTVYRYDPLNLLHAAVFYDHDIVWLDGSI